jgi:hypothetical protein
VNRDVECCGGRCGGGGEGYDEVVSVVVVVMVVVVVVVEARLAGGHQTAPRSLKARSPKPPRPSAQQCRTSLRPARLRRTHQSHICTVQRMARYGRDRWARRAVSE